MVTSEQYWIDRTDLIRNIGEKSAVRVLTDLERLYQSSMRTIEREISSFYTRFSIQEGVPVSEIKKRLTASEFMGVKADLGRYYSEVQRLGGYSSEYRQYLRQLSARAYLSRLEDLQIQIRHEIEGLFRQQNILFTENLSILYEDIYMRSNFDIQQYLRVGSEFTRLNTPMINIAIKREWLGDNYSSRIWTHKENLLRSLNTTFMQGVALGHNPNKIGRAMAKDIDNKYSRSMLGNAVRLARTEFLHIANEAAFESYKSFGITEKYQFLASLDERTCPTCGELDQETIYYNDAMPGFNMPTIHPNCRCTIVPYFPPDEIDEMFEKANRLAKDSAGNYYYVPADLSYTKWKEGLTEIDGILRYTGEDYETLEDFRKRRGY